MTRVPYGGGTGDAHAVEDMSSSELTLEPTGRLAASATFRAVFIDVSATARLPRCCRGVRGRPLRTAPALALKMGGRPRRGTGHRDQMSKSLST
jgi:hypothetical protein